MRLFAFVFALFPAGTPAIAEDWMEYEYPDYSFAVNFPAPAEHRDHDLSDAGRPPSFEARVYSVKQADGLFKPDDCRGPSRFPARTRTHWSRRRSTRSSKAAWCSSTCLTSSAASTGASSDRGEERRVFRRRGVHHKKRLDQIEGRAFVGGGQAEVDAMRFQQSLDLT